MTARYFLTWFLAGLILVAPLLLYARNKTTRANQFIFGRGLVVAAAIYVGFALLEASTVWIFIELAGFFAFTAFYWLTLRGSMYWLVAGWLMHPAWDGIIHLVGPGATIAPSWYAVACISFDWAIAIFLTTRLRTDRASVS